MSFLLGYGEAGSSGSGSRIGDGGQLPVLLAVQQPVRVFPGGAVVAGSANQGAVGRVWTAAEHANSAVPPAGFAGR